MSKNFEVIFKEFADSDTFVMSRELLEDYKRQAAQDERDRIIKLLENPNCKPNDHDYNGGCNCDVIVFIKGENE